MAVIAMDHVNLHTCRFDAMVDFYRDVIGLRAEPRANPSKRVMWLYAGDRAIIHVVELVAVADREVCVGTPGIEHFALRTNELSSLMHAFQSACVDTRLSVDSGTHSLHVNLRDPDGNRLHFVAPLDELERIAADPALKELAADVLKGGAISQCNVGDVSGSASSRGVHR